MPLRDHFHPPLSDVSSWEEVHGGWPMVIVQQLGKMFPPQYTAGPRVHLGSEWEIDVATFDSETAVGTSRLQSEEGVAVATAWAPAEPTLVAESAAHDRGHPVPLLFLPPRISRRDCLVHPALPNTLSAKSM